MVSAGIAIIGCGPRGLGLLERLISVAAAGGQTIDVPVVEPGDLGVGMHQTDQPDYLLLNTVCSQLTAFSDYSMLGTDGLLYSGPSLFEWCRQRDIRVAADGYRCGDTGRPVQPHDHLPRRLLGEYLAWAAERIVAAAPPSVRITHHRQPAVRVETVDGAERVLLADGSSLVADHAVIAVGHGHSPGPYPLPATVSDIAAGSAVALLGAGLTAMDVLAALTSGRGGTFDPRPDGRLRYTASGEEPRVVLVSREGRPARARPRLDPGRRPLPGRHLTPERITELRATRPDGRLDFEVDVLPLVLAEMEYRWRTLGGAGDPPPFRDLLFGQPPAEALRGAEEHRRWYLGQVTDDLAQAQLGLPASHLKEALEVLRDHRDVLRVAVDGGGLTESSRDWFFGRFAGVANRAVIGPQLERHQELLALVDAGVVQFGPGPQARIEPHDERWLVSSTRLGAPAVIEVDHVVNGYSQADPLAHPLLRTLAEAGRGRPDHPTDRRRHATGHPGRPRPLCRRPALVVRPDHRGQQLLQPLRAHPGRPLPRGHRRRRTGPAAARPDPARPLAGRGGPPCRSPLGTSTPPGGRTTGRRR